MIGRRGFVAVIAVDCYVVKTEPGALQHQDQLVLAIVFDLLRVDFLLQQLPILPQPGTDLAVEIFGRWVEGEVAEEPLFDRSRERMHA